MTKRRDSSDSTNLIVPAIGLLLLIFLIAFFVWSFTRKSSPLPPSPSPSAPATTPSHPTESDLVSDDRILFGGAPRAGRSAASFTVLKNTAYMVGYSEERKDPLWSAYRVFHKVPPFVLERPKGEFLTDDRTAARVTHHDFTGTGFDRGHMTPNAAIARCYGEKAQKETFLLSNICPQAPALNQKVWEKLEMKEIEYADRDGEVWVVDGPVFGDMNGGTTRTLRAGIAVPAAFYKILIEQQAGNLRVFAVIMPQTVKGTELPQQFLTSIREIEKETGLEFLWKLEARQREELEGKVWPMWE